MKLQSTINDSTYYYSEEEDAESDTNRDPKIATHTSHGKKRKVTDNDTTNGNSTHKSLMNRLITDIIPVIIPKIYQTTADAVAASGDTLHARRKIISK